MKIAFVTFYSSTESSFEINNGFSFITHFFRDVDHFFITISDNREDIREKLTRYDLVFVSISYLPQFNYIREIADERWVLGGQLFEGFFYSQNTRAKIYKKSFESYLGRTTGNIFIPYWSDFIKTKEPKNIRYNAICSRSCYWKRCLYCIYKIVRPEEYERDVRSILYQLPVYDCPSTAVISTGSIPPKMLGTAIDISTKIDKKIQLQTYVRFDQYIRKVLEKDNDLSHFTFCVGIESFSQKTLDRLGKGIKVNDMLMCIKHSLDRGAKVKAFILNNIPMDTKEAKQNITSINWIEKNIKYTPMSVDDNGYTMSGNFLINKGDGIEWPDEETASMFGSYIVEKDITLDYYKRVWPNNMRIRSTITEKERELNKLVLDRINFLFSVVDFK